MVDARIPWRGKSLEEGKSNGRVVRAIVRADFDVKEENFVSGRGEGSPSQHRIERFSAPMSRDRQKALSLHFSCPLFPTL
jgi:hypothetical protein